MWDVEGTISRRTAQLHEWRSRYSRGEYPSKVIQNLFYELYGTQFTWDLHCRDFFAGEKKFSSFKDALDHVAAVRNKIMIETVNPRLAEILESAGPTCAKLEFSLFQQMIEDAQNGDNGEVAEVELSFVYYVTASELVLPWFACGLTGMSRHSAFRDVTGGDIGGFSMETYDEAIQNLAAFSGMYIDSSFERLPPLW